ncbi:hypothetical protein PspLS_06010 [Pyricularia sp. CBS 133598]|nr:hypothetical protein PspLS_06010 [Pyricularia sp. CBS 133598]
MPDTMPTRRESEPLLGRPGDATQASNQPFYANLYLGTGFFTLVGVVMFCFEVWYSTLSQKFLPLFTPHPLLQSAAVAIALIGVLILQPTTSADPERKRQGARLHAGIMGLAGLTFMAGVAIIEANKIKGNNPHFKSLHAYLGVATAIIIACQATFGVFMWAVPGAFGGVENAKATWKYHRWFAYVVVLPMVVFTCLSSLETGFNVNVLHMRPWIFYLSFILAVMGIAPRVHLDKLGFPQPTSI